jgi:hypothetical protein
VYDRININANKYPDEYSRKALVWGSCEGQARDYLEYRYCAEDPANGFSTWEEMIKLLNSYYITGY